MGTTKNHHQGFSKLISGSAFSTFHGKMNSIFKNSQVIKVSINMELIWNEELDRNVKKLKTKPQEISWG